MAIAAATLMSSSVAFATNGYFAHGYSTKEKGMAGAGVAYSQDALASATNPAGMVKVGTRLDVGLAIFSPRREYTVEGNPTGQPGTFPLMPGTAESDNDYFAIPHFGYNKMISDVTAIGVSVYGSGGMNTEYKGVASPMAMTVPGASGTFGGGTAGVDLKQLFINASLSHQVDKHHAIGVSAVTAIQTFEAKGLQMFGQMSTDASKLTNNDADISTGIGIKVGWQGDAGPIAFGASYQSQINMSLLEDYSGLFANGGEFNIPATATLGVAIKTSPTTTLVFDAQHIAYGDVDSIGNSVQNLMAYQDGSGRLGGENGAGFGWEDMTIYKFGYEFGTSTKYRLGVSHAEQPITDGQNMFNILAPAVIETHYTAGFTTPLSDTSEFSLAAMYAPSNTITGPTGFDAQTVSLKMDQYELQASYSQRF